jgi:predicted metal-binding protein
MTHPSNENARPKHTDYILTHCRTCAAGWTRTRENGEAVIACLLDRETVIADMTQCDRFEARNPEG